MVQLYTLYSRYPLHTGFLLARVDRRRRRELRHCGAGGRDLVRVSFFRGLRRIRSVNISRFHQRGAASARLASLVG